MQEVIQALPMVKPCFQFFQYLHPAGSEVRTLVSQIDIGAYEYPNGTTEITEHTLPEQFHLLSAYPNPFKSIYEYLF